MVSAIIKKGSVRKSRQNLGKEKRMTLSVGKWNKAGRTQDVC